MRKILPIIWIFAMTVLWIGCTKKQVVDLILLNGHIQSVDAEMQVFEAMAVKEGRIVELGTSEMIRNAYNAPNIVDLEGKQVYPGFIDPHSHYMGYSMNLLHANLWMSESMEEIVSRLQQHRAGMMGDWLQGRGWDQNLFAVKEMPDNKLLNEAFPDTPVYIVRVDGHAAVANDKALKMAGIKGDMQVDGGQVVVRNGEPTGLLIDRAMYLVSSQIPQPTPEDRIALLKRGQQNLFEVGLTSVCDAGLDKEAILLLDSLQKNQELSIRVYAMLNPTEENFAYFLPGGPYVTDHLSVRSVKHYADGALGSRGALMKQPYSDATNTSGLLIDTEDVVGKTCQLAFDHGYQVNVHCIGDSAVSYILDLFGQFLEPGNDLRWRIEHAQVVDPAEYHKFGDYNIVPSIQAIHAVSDMGWAENRVGPQRIKGAYAYRDLMNQAGWLPNGSDFPVEQINPLYSYHAAFTRQDNHGNPSGGWYPEQRLSREEALRGMTIWAAKANFEEDTRGSLEPGKFADFVIMKADLLVVEEDAIYGLPILQTWLGGKKVYEYSN